MKTSAFLFLAALSVGSSWASAQDPSFHAVQRDRLDIAGAVFADCWGLDNRAYSARFGQGTFDILDMSNPDNLSLLRTFNVAGPNGNASVQDIKAARSAVRPARTLVFVSIESGGPDGVQIYDATNPASPSLLTNIDVNPGNYSTTHNLSVRNDGWLVLCNSFTSTLALVDLTSYDPLSAPANITSWDYQLTGLGTGFVHDITITDKYLFISQWDSLLVYDVSNLGSSAPSFVAQVQGLSSHAVWVTSDSRYVVTTEERQGGAIRLFEIDDSGASVVLRQTDSYVSPGSGASSTFSAHNPVILDDRVYVSNYSAGVVVLEIDRTTGSFDRVASYDTSTRSPNNFDGAWGVYPLNGHDRVIVSDLDNGVYTIDFSALQFVSPSPRPLTVAANSGTPITVTINELGSISLDPTSVNLRASINGGAFNSIPMANIGGQDWQANLPAMACGDKVEYFFRATDMGGQIFTFPAASPADTHVAYATNGLVDVLVDNFSSDKGWSVFNSGVVTSGAWERGVPVETSAQPGVDSTGDAGNACYITQNGSPGGSASSTDLDGGPTLLISPLLDFSNGDGVISYSRWLFNNNADNSDTLMVEVRTSDSSPWVLVESLSLLAGGWVDHSFRISDYVAPSATVRVRFSAQDTPNNSLTDAGVDNFRAQSLCDGQILASANLVNGGGSNPLCVSSSAPVIGQMWTSTLDNTVRPAATASMLLVYAQGTSGIFLGGGEVLVDLSSALYITSTLPAIGTSTDHNLAVPANGALAGLTARVQGLVLGGGYTLCNAYDITVGF